MNTLSLQMLVKFLEEKIEQHKIDVKLYQAADRQMLASFHEGLLTAREGDLSLVKIILAEEIQKRSTMH
jgi:hypothetical protein